MLISLFFCVTWKSGVLVCIPEFCLSILRKQRNWVRANCWLCTKYYSGHMMDCWYPLRAYSIIILGCKFRGIIIHVYNVNSGWKLLKLIYGVVIQTQLSFWGFDILVVSLRPWVSILFKAHFLCALFATSFKSVASMGEWSGNK